MSTVDFVKQICKDRHIPISKLERDCGFSNGYIAGLRRGKFPADRLQVIAEYLDVSIEYLLNLGEQPKVQISGLEEEYYEDAEIRDIVDLLHKSPEHKILMSASKHLSKKDLELIIEMVERMS